MEKNIYEVSYKMKRELHERIMTVVLAAVICFLFLTLFMKFILFSVKVKSVSMDPDISSGSVIFVSPLFHTPGRGDVVLLDSIHQPDTNLFEKSLNVFVGFFTGQQYFPFTTTQRMGGTRTVRRVAGLPGDTVYLENYILHIKPKGDQNFLTEFELSPFEYSILSSGVPDGWDEKIGASAKMSELTLGPDEYFVLGDNRTQCVDSRLWGCVKSSSFAGKVIMVYFPFNRFTCFSKKNK